LIKDTINLIKSNSQITHITCLVLLFIIIATPVSAKTINETLLNHLKKQYADYPNTRYVWNSIDLNNDGIDEVIVYPAGPLICGSGGCETLIFQSKGKAFTLISRIGLTKLPIFASSNIKNGWKNLIVWRGGGGGKSGFVALTYDGTRYPTSANLGKPVDCNQAENNDCQIKVIKDYKAFANATPLF